MEGFNEKMILDLLNEQQKTIKLLKKEIKSLKTPKKTIEDKAREKMRIKELIKAEEYAKGCPKCDIIGPHCCFYATPKPRQGQSIYY